MDINSIRFDSVNFGSKLLVLGSIHGDEICGSIAINNIINKIKSGELKLKCGIVTFISVCNPKAYRNNKRYYETNLNRVIKKTNNPIVYEEKIANILTKYIDDCDYMLDIHSMAENGKPFAFQDYLDIKNEEFAKAQELEYIIQGWPEIYKNCSIQDFSTQTYCCKTKNKIGVTVECGSHNSPNAVKIAEQCIINTLSYLNMIEERTNNNILPKIIKMDKVFLKEKEGIINNFNNFDLVKKGEIIAKYYSGENIIADDEYIMILPNNKANINEEWFYLGKI